MRNVQMVLQLFTDHRRMHSGTDAVLRQHRRVANPGQLQQLGRIDRATADHHFAARQGLQQLSVPRVLHTDGPSVVDQDTGGMGLRVQTQVGARQRGAQECTGCGLAPALARIDLVNAHAFTGRPIEVVRMREPQGPGSLQEAAAQRMDQRRDVVHMQRAARTMVRARAPGVVLGALEERQNAAPAPARITQALPLVVVFRLPAHVGHGVDRARTAQHLAARPVGTAATQGGFGFGLVHPVDCGIAKAARITNRYTNRQAAVTAARLQQQHARGRIRGQAVGQYTTGRTSTNHYVVPLLHRLP